jgi:hypothetical protein
MSSRISATSAPSPWSGTRCLKAGSCPVDRAAHAALSKAIDEAARDDIDTDTSKYSLAIPDADGAGCVATLLPIDRGERLLAQGLGAKEAADMLGISEPTVRTHLQHMFAKTDTTRQTDLLRLLRNSTPPIQAGGRPDATLAGLRAGGR